MKTTTDLAGPALSVHAAYSMEKAQLIARMFQLSGSLQVEDFTNKGNIHGDTFLITATEGGTCREYLLQRINHHVFTRPRSVMAAMMACTQAQWEYLQHNPLPSGEDWQVIHLVPT